MLIAAAAAEADVELIDLLLLVIVYVAGLTVGSKPTRADVTVRLTVLLFATLAAASVARKTSGVDITQSSQVVKPVGGE